MKQFFPAAKTFMIVLLMACIVLCGLAIFSVVDSRWVFSCNLVSLVLGLAVWARESAGPGENKHESFMRKAILVVWALTAVYFFAVVFLCLEKKIDYSFLLLATIMMLSISISLYERCFKNRKKQ